MSEPLWKCGLAWLVGSHGSTPSTDPGSELEIWQSSKSSISLMTETAGTKSSCNPSRWTDGCGAAKAKSKATGQGVVAGTGTNSDVRSTCSV